jgi:hypothetical protein
MNEMVSMAIALHIGAIFLILLLLVLLVLLFRKIYDFKAFSYKYEKLNLYYRATLGALFFTGIVVMAVVKFDVSWIVYVMVLATLIMIGTSIKENIVYKRTHIKDRLSQETFISYAKRKYILDIIMIVVIGVVAYAVSL